MKETVLLSIIIPAYNEEKNISSTLSEISEYLSKKDFSCEVIVIDDGSKDKTVQEALGSKGKLPNLRVVESRPNRGKGYVVRKAMLQADGDYLMFMDADNSTSIKELDKFLPYLKEGYDVVIGSRRLKGSEIVVPESALRIVLGNIYILLSKILIGVKASDFNCGFKAYRKEAAKKIFPLQKMDDWSFDTEILFIITKLGLKMKEIPVKWGHKFTSKVKPFSAGINSFISLAKIKINDLTGVYNN